MGHGAICCQRGFQVAAVVAVAVEAVGLVKAARELLRLQLVRVLSEIYLEKCFQEDGLAPAERLPVARDLGDTSLMALVHPTTTPEQITALADWLRAQPGTSPSCVWIATAHRPGTP